MSSTRSRRKKGGRVQRLTSNVFAMFDQAQIQEFKEAFNMIDQNRDGYVDKDDLQDIMVSLGKDPSDDYLEKMITEAPGPINFTMFLTLFGERLNGTDPEDVIRNAFACFDDRHSGSITEEYFRECMMTMGDRWSEEMVDDLFYGAPIKDGRLDYVEFTRNLKHGSRDKDHDDIPDIKPDIKPEQEVADKIPPEVPPKPSKN
ncbi:ML12B-like protein [Mya arenaria]|uniref:ML12B-like protein n=1 Tax=Mya arenaria TaxID=6604 RepID=A0ABY7F6A7_MYAAR|nr:myosin regulatory light chain 12A-like [Mya arenaria]XP_052761519.1 myosin regulatory light chain 12A-like [Mya arenaria]WAR17722.1 ML12B-like protein [Mya arenaria]